MRTGEAHPFETRHVAEGAQQLVEEGTSPGDVAAVGVDVLAEDGDLGNAGVTEHRGFGDEVL